MKKISAIVVILLTSLLLVSCDGSKFHAKVSIDVVEKTVSSIEVEALLKDDENQVNSDIGFYLYEGTNDKGKFKSKYTRNKAELEKDNATVKFTGLEENTSYYLVVQTTWSGRTRVMFKNAIETVVRQTMDINTMDDFFQISQIEAKNETRMVYNLKTDLDFTGQEDKIKTNLIGTFRGEFHGNNHTLKNYKFSTTNSSIGLFGQLNEDSVIKDVVLDGFEITRDFPKHSNPEDYKPTGNSAYQGILFGHNPSSKVVIEDVVIKNSTLNANVDSTSKNLRFGFIGGAATGTFTNIDIQDTNVMNLNVREFTTIYAGGAFGELNQNAIVNQVLANGLVNLSVEQSDKSGLIGESVSLNFGGFAGQNSKASVEDIIVGTKLEVSKFDLVVKSKGTDEEVINNTEPLNVKINIGGLYGIFGSTLTKNAIFNGDINFNALITLKNELDVETLHKYNIQLLIGGLVGDSKQSHYAYKNYARTAGTINVIEQTNLKDIKLHKLIANSTGNSVDYAKATALGIFGILNDLYNNLETGFANDLNEILKITDLNEFFKDQEWILSKLA